MLLWCVEGSVSMRCLEKYSHVLFPSKICGSSSTSYPDLFPRAERSDWNTSAPKENPAHVRKEREALSFVSTWLDSPFTPTTPITKTQDFLQSLSKFPARTIRSSIQRATHQWKVSVHVCILPRYRMLRDRRNFLIDNRSEEAARFETRVFSPI